MYISLAIIVECSATLFHTMIQKHFDVLMRSPYLSLKAEESKKQSLLTAFNTMQKSMNNIKLSILLISLIDQTYQ